METLNFQTSKGYDVVRLICQIVANYNILTTILMSARREPKEDLAVDCLTKEAICERVTWLSPDHLRPLTFLIVASM